MIGIDQPVWLTVCETSHRDMPGCTVNSSRPVNGINLAVQNTVCETYHWDKPGCRENSAGGLTLG